MMDTISSREKFLDQVQNDLKAISLESKRIKSLQSLREATEEAIVKVRSSNSASNSISSISSAILYPVVQGCESKDPKIVRLCLGLMQRLIINHAVDFKGGRVMTDTLWMLMEAGLEEVKLLQTITLLLTSSHVVQHETLAKCLVICFRLCFTKDLTTSVTAGATVRQLVPLVFERVTASNESKENGQRGAELMAEEPSPQFQAHISNMLPKDTDPFVIDAYLMFQDIVLLISADQPVWLSGIVEMTRSFGLELLESILRKFPQLLTERQEFRMLLKERVCSLVIKLFSPNIKYRGGGNADGSQSGSGHQERPYYPITSKLLRVVTILVLEYHNTLTTETEIFLSLVLKFLGPDKASWQNNIALEVVHKIMVEPKLLIFICKRFDLNDHSTKVFQDMVNALGSYVQNVMMTPSSANEVDGKQSNSASPGFASGSGPGSAPQPGFYHRNVWRPLTMSFIGGQTKELFLDIGERTDVPTVSDGYGVSIAYASILDVVRSLSIIMRENYGNSHDKTLEETCKQLIQSSWCGILAALSLLLDSSTDDGSTENILKSLETYSSICGKLGLNKPRDAYLASICKASLPPHYTLNVLKATPTTQMVSGPSAKNSPDTSIMTSSTVAASATGSTFEATSGAGVDTDIRHQVVAVGTPLPTSSLPASAHQGPVMLTAKNLQCMRSILSVAHCHGNMLGQSWHIILTTLQHLVWILGLKPVAGGGLSGGTGLSSSSSSGSSENNSVITSAIMADLPVLSSMVTRLFESSGDLEEASVNYLIDALCKLSFESMDLASNNREPSLFAVAKLLETALVNLTRLDMVWRPITSHLLLVCQHPHLRMRQWGCEALTFLTRQSLSHKYDPPLAENNRVQILLLSPLAELCGMPYPDIRQKQLDTVLHILHGSGELLDQGWPLILTMVSSLDTSHSDILIRSAFQCLQLIFTDFLPTLPYRCYPQCVEAATKFGSQETELNVSLTAVGLLWNLSDYFFQNVKRLQQAPNQGDNSKIFPEFPGCNNMTPFDKLWMCLYYKLKDLCLDPRPAVRKSAGQTLFSTIAAHGSVLQPNTWQAVLWQVLFPLLDNVIIQSDSASAEKVSQSSVIMMHHSRNTAQKQWAETKVLTISGVARVFNTKRKLLRNMEDYSKAWLLLLEYVEKVALSETAEVSLAALKGRFFFHAMQEMILSSGDESALHGDDASELKAINWTLCWKAWLNIGTQKTKFIANTADVVPYSQVLLTGFLQIYVSLLDFVHTSLREKDIRQLGEVLLACAQIPVDGDLEAPGSLSQVHSAAMDAMKKTEVVLGKDPNMEHIFQIYFKLATFAFNPGEKNYPRFAEKLLIFGETVLEQIGDFFVASASSPSEIGYPLTATLHRIVQVLRTPLEKRYQCAKQSNWRVAVAVLIKVLKQGLPLLRAQKTRKEHGDQDHFWMELSSVLEDFLFPDSLQDQVLDDRMADEAVDCHLIELLRQEILPFPSSVPAEFIRRIVILLNKGSIHSTIQLSEDCSGSIGLREDFAKECFETLLDFSLLKGGAAETNKDAMETHDDTSLTNKLAITSLLQRFKEVLVDAIDGEKLKHNIPLQRQKTAEIAFVLRAIATVVASLKKASDQPNGVDVKTWQQVISLYPYLVQCTGSNSPQVNSSVKDALLEYQDLLTPLGK